MGAARPTGLRRAEARSRRAGARHQARADVAAVAYRFVPAGLDWAGLEALGRLRPELMEAHGAPLQADARDAACAANDPQAPTGTGVEPGASSLVQGVSADSAPDQAAIPAQMTEEFDSMCSAPTDLGERCRRIAESDGLCSYHSRRSRSAGVMDPLDLINWDSDTEALRAMSEGADRPAPGDGCDVEASMGESEVRSPVTDPAAEAAALGRGSRRGAEAGAAPARGVGARRARRREWPTGLGFRAARHARAGARARPLARGDAPRI